MEALGGTPNYALYVKDIYSIDGITLPSDTHQFGAIMRLWCETGRFRVRNMPSCITERPLSHGKTHMDMQRLGECKQNGQSHLTPDAP